jgi:thiosulfate/3-mercaptopyruvate sulfurtransferase
MYGALALFATTALLLGSPANTFAEPLASPGAIVSTDWLQQHVDDPHVRVICTGSRDSYEAGHIPGARLLDHMATLGAEHHLMATDALMTVLSKAGAADDVRIVLYGDDPMATGWVFMAFASLGHGRDVSFLDGNIALWKDEKRPLSTTTPKAAADHLTATPATDVAVDADWVRGHLKSPDVRVLDVRTQKEWSDGHLPGAPLVLWQDLFADRKTLKFKSPEELRAVFTKAGVSPGQQIVTYCAVGMRASLMYFAAQAVGLPARVYVGSFSDWQKNSANPIER